MTIYNHPELYQALCDIKETQDCRVYFHKAAYEYLYLEGPSKTKKKLKKALDNVKIAIRLYEDNSFKIIKNKPKLNKKISDKLTRIWEKAPKNYLVRMYQLAAEIYAELDDFGKSLEYYKKYYYYVNKVPVSKELQDKSEAFIYSFRYYNTYSLEDLINDEITCVHPNKMNDPFDSIASYVGDFKTLEKLCSRKKHIKPQSDCFKHFTIRSFFANRETYSDDDNILYNKLMWSHYSDSHKGFCVKYRVKKTAFKQFDDSNEVFTRLVPVKYSSGEISISEKLNTDTSFAMKNSDWESESEVRFVHFSKDCDADHTPIKLNNDITIEEVIFGIKCSQDAKRTIDAILKGKCKLSEIYNDDEKDICSLKKRDYPSQF